MVDMRENDTFFTPRGPTFVGLWYEVCGDTECSIRNLTVL